MSKTNKDFSVAIGIPVYNEEDNIEFLLNNLVTQKIGESFKLERILVVASGCTDRTPEIVKELENIYRIINLICEEKRKGKASALNIIFEELKSDIVILMGGDVSPRKDCLKNLLKPFKIPSVGAVSSHPIPVNLPEKFADTAACLIWDLHDLFSRELQVKLTGELFAVRGGIIEKFDSRITCDDAFIEYLIRNMNYEIKYAPNAVVDIKGPKNFRDLLIQRRRNHAGYQQIKHLTGKSIKTATIRESIMLLMKVFKKNFKNKWFLPIILSEILVRLLGYLDYLKGNYHTIWERVSSTKDLSLTK